LSDILAHPAGVFIAPSDNTANSPFSNVIPALVPKYQLLVSFCAQTSENNKQNNGKNIRTTFPFFSTLKNYLRIKIRMFSFILSKWDVYMK
jgi:hypothetical protein